MRIPTVGLLGLPIPSFLAELEGPTFRPRLEFSVRSGLILVLVFGALACWAAASGIVPTKAALAWPVLLKLTTNTVAWLAIRRDKFVLLTTSVNVFVDVVAMTWAIYLTGGAMSPLIAIYAIELTVVALLSNLGTTVLISTIALAQYVGMLAFVHAGFIRSMPPVIGDVSEISTRYLVLHAAVAAFVLGVPTFFTAAILRTLREKRDALERRTRELVDASTERAQFMANITHELRTPIHGIRGLVDLMNSGVYGPLDPRQARAHDEIKRSAESLLGLVDDLLELSRADAGRLSLETSEVDLDEVVVRLVASTRGLIGTRTLRFETSLAPTLPHAITDRAKLAQILLNLLANAVKFTPDEGRVTFRAIHEPDAVRFEVEDTGIGIPKEHLERIFEPFHQVDGSTAREYGGVGLGLALADRLAKLLDFELAVTSELGRGSRFSVRIPIAPRPAEPALEPSFVASLT